MFSLHVLVCYTYSVSWWNFVDVVGAPLRVYPQNLLGARVMCYIVWVLSILVTWVYVNTEFSGEYLIVIQWLCVG